ncbi:MAG: hypothetical protein ISP90_02875 [Nevskia sp.]|nr:hypothetical protein [Nevskia sp.]
MRFTELKIDPTSLANSLAEIKSKYATSRHKEPWTDYVAGYIWKRLREAPERYVEYGPYWWAVKAALAAKGFEIGTETDQIVMPEYSYQAADGSLDVDLCLAAGEQFKEMYCDSYFADTRDFALTANGDAWTLFDDDLEVQALARWS